MKVSELIEALALFPQDAIVMLDLIDTKDKNFMDLAHIYTVPLTLDKTKVAVILDADWSKQCES